MSQQKAVKMIQLSFVILLFSFLFASCGDDDDPVKPTVDAGLYSVNGFYYKAVMGAVNNIEFLVGNPDKTPMTGSWVHFSMIIGDGTLVTDSVQVDANGRATCQYTFSGSLGHAELQALVRNVDTTTVTLRANTLIPGATGQAQYILMEDWYSDIKNFNGEPECVDVADTTWNLYAVYESSLGVVFYLNDIDKNEIASDADQVVSIIVNSNYTGKTSDSIGIGSKLGDVTSVYGAIGDEQFEGAGTISNCGVPVAVDADWKYTIPTQGLTIYTDTNAVYVDRQIFEIHLSENVTASPATVKLKSGSTVLMSEAMLKRGQK